MDEINDYDFANFGVWSALKDYLAAKSSTKNKLIKNIGRDYS